MSEVLLYRLQMNREAILQDLEPEQVMDYLYQEDVLDGDKYDEVSDKGSRKKQAELLLSYVERDSSAIQKMIDALKGSSQRHLACILNEALPDEVTRSKGILKSFQNDLDSPYPMTHVPCGYAVIINNSDFHPYTKLEQREGSEKDVKTMEELFKWLQFNVDIYENQTAAEIVSIVRKYRVEIDHTNFDCFVLFLMSHGFEDGIFGTDGRRVKLREEIRKQLTADKCFSLANKPKLIFVQACRGGEADKGFVVSDSPDDQFSVRTTPAQVVNNYPTYTPSNLDVTPDYNPEVDVEYIPQDSDIIIAYASTAYHAALRHTETGGWFVTQLYEVMRKYAKDEDLQSMITRVTGLVSAKKTRQNLMQCPEQIGNLRKKVFFKPKS
ncbi:caspase-9 [Paramuricea clavata]|uniref:Caspase-9 n=1 Tax=Paramuricea clavata TaxID=317549 RepID=A0A7D9D6J0_PARCT|nr:caspase-9 [Paramuricea clavata]